MRVLVLILLLAVLAYAQQPAKQEKFVAKWGIPSFEDEACVLCQYVVQRVENRLVQRLDQLDKSNKVPGAGMSLIASTTDPFGKPAGVQPPMEGFAGSAAEIKSVLGATAGNVNNAMMDLSFEPTIAYKKDLIRSLRTRWGGSSIVRYIWEDFLTEFCSQERIPEIYVPVCSMMYESARKIMKNVFYGFPTDQTCMMAKMCGRNSYFAAPTAVHDPVMSLYWNNKRGLDGFEGGIHGVTKSDIKSTHSDRHARLVEAQATAKSAAKEARKAALAAEKKRLIIEQTAQRRIQDAKELAELKKKRAERKVRREYKKKVQERDQMDFKIQLAAAKAAAAAGAQAATAAAAADQHARANLHQWQQRMDGMMQVRRFNPQSVEDVDPRDIPANLQKYYILPNGSIDPRKKSYLWELLQSGALKLGNGAHVGVVVPPSVFQQPIPTF